MTRAIEKYNPKYQNLILLLVVGVIVWIIIKNKGSGETYQNTKTWDIEWDPVTGMPTRITKHVNARVE